MARKLKHRPSRKTNSQPPHRKKAQRPAPAGKKSSGGLRVAKASNNTKKSIKRWLQDGTRLVAPPPPEDGQELSLDPWQQEALDALTDGQSVIVDAPTTAGKTRVVEAFFQRNLDAPDFRAAYTTPVKSLSNDKLKEFRAMFGKSQVGIATGDIKENLNAPIVVCTLETYRNSLLGTEPDLGRNLVVFDEYHYMQDTSRGSAWEEALILTPHSCQILMLSASVKNSDEFCGWLAKIHGRGCQMVRAGHRPVPLEDLVYVQNEWVLKSELKSIGRQNLDHRLMRMPLDHQELAQRLAKLTELELLPCIVYAGRRLACESLATAIANTVSPLSEQQTALIQKSLELSQAEFNSLDFMPKPLRIMIETRGVGFHHSGMAPPLRLAMEALVKDGLLRFCVATMGLSLGINFSVRSALISDYQRPDEQGFVDYRPSEILQMLGRAGRRGKDTVGFSLWACPEAMQRLAKRHRDSCDSRLRNDPTTYLGLVGRSYSTGQIERFYERSFRRYQDKRANLCLINPDRLRQHLNVAKLDCGSPAGQYSLYIHENPSAKCHSTTYRKACHRWITKQLESDLAQLQLHLHNIGALDAEDNLTRYGNIARFFPQNGGLLVAHFLADGRISLDNLMQASELMGALTLARFKSPGAPPQYRFPFHADRLEQDLEALYPYELFPEIYDRPYGQRNYPVIREFNPAAGYAIRSWQQGMSWDVLVKNVTSENFGVGDLMSLIYRVATYLQSLGQTKMPTLADGARSMRDELLRPPLSLTLMI